MRDIISRHAVRMSSSRQSRGLLRLHCLRDTFATCDWLNAERFSNDECASVHWTNDGWGRFCACDSIQIKNTQIKEETIDTSKNLNHLDKERLKQHIGRARDRTQRSCVVPKNLDLWLCELLRKQDILANRTGRPLLMRGADRHLHDANGEIGNELQDIRGITETHLPCRWDRAKIKKKRDEIDTV